jgi:asparagine synthase (glutamine-hydrolysing)
MCGICGIYGSEDQELLAKMMTVLRHRGPDDKGVYHNKNVSLGHRRLSIIDLNTGKQPIFNEDRSICIVYNGEIYNFIELREILKKKGHKFVTNTDTEVVVHAYEEYGVNCVKKFNGMFAFALWDGNKKLLFIARDRFGIKPFFYYKNGNKLIFASEIKAIFQDPTVEKIANEDAIYNYLIRGIHDHDEVTFFQNIHSLLPAHYMIVKNGNIKIQRYWQLAVNKDIEASNKDDDDEEKRVQEFYELFEDSVRKRLISDVPVGTCLSGGLDSSTITSIINKLLLKDESTKDVIGDKQKTFSAVYEDREVDERNYIESVINSAKAEKNYVFPDSKTLISDLKKMLKYHDEPFGGPSIYAQWKVMELASKKVKVLLDGQGGDEVLAGYIYFYLEYFMELFRKRKLLRLANEVMFSLDKLYPILKLALVQRKMSKLSKSFLNRDMIKQRKKISQQTSADDGIEPSNTLADRLYLSLTKYQIPHLLRYEDRNSMAFSIEARVPFLDHRVVEFVYSLPQKYRINFGWTKYILRKSMKGTLPEKIRFRRSKLGFATPQDKWLKELREPIRKIFSSKKFGKRELFNQKIILDAFDRFCNGKLEKYYASTFWKILLLELWFETIIDN